MPEGSPAALQAAGLGGCPADPGFHPGLGCCDPSGRQRSAVRVPATHPFSVLTGVIPLSFVVCVSDTAILHDNLLGSPCLENGSPHEVISVLQAPDAAAGLNAALERARHEWVVLVHQDVVLPDGWDRCVGRQLLAAERRFGPLGIAGVYGVGGVERPEGGSLQAERIGWVVDRGRSLRQGPELPAPVATLDELLLILPRRTPLRADPELGFHLYGADLCLQAREHGLAAIALGALCHHNSRRLGLDDAYFASARTFVRKWAERLPIATPCAVFDKTGEVFLLGNAEGETSVARAEGRCVYRVPLELWMNETPRWTPPRFAPRGPNKSARGNAPGTEKPP